MLQIVESKIIPFLLSNYIKTFKCNPIDQKNIYKVGRAPLFALFHSTQMLAASYMPDFRTNILVSLSRDGEIAARTLERLGFSIVRGSSSRGGKEAFQDLVVKVNAGESVAITVDGPRGPYQDVKSGIIRLASKTGVPIICVSAAAPYMYRLKGSWDRFVVAPPSSKVFVKFSEPIMVGDVSSEGEIDRFRNIIKEILITLSSDLSKIV